MPKPREGEKRDAYISRCIPVVIREGTAKDGKQGYAVCSSMWAEAKRRGGRRSATLSALPSQLLRELRGLADGARVTTGLFEGREHLIVPVVALVGDSVVRAIGSYGPEFVPSATLSAVPSAWDGRPVLADHPNLGRSSANDPATLEALSFGRLFNTRFKNGRLLTEAWLDIDKAKRLGGPALEVLRRCLMGELVEVSVGAWVNVEKRPGISAGNRYDWIWTEVTPDHLAMGLNGQAGACSIAAGCGAPRAAASAFEVQALIFPKEHWQNAGACRKWAGDHGFKSGDAEETSTSWRMRQREPGDFMRLRTICLSGEGDPKRCRVKGVGGPLKGGARAAGGPGSGNWGHAGRPGEVGGSAPAEGGSGGQGEPAEWKGEGGWRDSGVTWDQPTDATTGRPIPIKVKSVEEAVPLVLAGKVVELPDVGSAATLIDKLAVMAAEAKAAGKDAINYNLCQVSVAGSNLFCGESLGIARIDMPQLAGEPVTGSEAAKLAPDPRTGEVDGAGHFIAYLQGLGIKTTEGEIQAASLKASQRELVGTKVGGMMRNRSYDPGRKAIFTSSDNYIVDGHHRWAAVIGRDAEDGVLGNATMMRIRRVNAPISEVLRLANEWARRFGIKQKRAARAAGGPGSGNFGHAGRPGEVGGSAAAAAEPTGAERSGVIDPSDFEDVLVEEYGRTDSPGDGGFILRDGDFLDMSEGGGMGRTADHRNINFIETAEDNERESETDKMLRIATETEMIRWSPEAWAADILTAPTRKQIDTLAYLAGWKELIVEFPDGKSVTYSDEKEALYDLRRRFHAGRRAAGGAGSGNFGHAGRPGEVGGSAPGDTSGDRESPPSDSKLAREAAEAIPHIEEMTAGAIEKADWSAAEDRGWSDVDSDVQTEAFMAFYEEASDEAWGSVDFSQLEKDLAESVRNEDSLTQEARTDTIAALERQGFGKDTEATLPGMEGAELRRVLDPESFVLDENWEASDGDNPELQLSELCWRGGEPLSEADQQVVAEVWAQQYERDFDDAIQSARENDSSYQEQQSQMIDEYVQQEWDALPDEDKFNFAEEHNLEVGSHGISIVPGEPTKWETGSDPNLDRGDENYQRTAAIATELVNERTVEIAKERGVEALGSGEIAHLWSEWKSSSSSDYGTLLQYAAALELGGVHRFDAATVAFIKSRHPEARIDATRAYVRAQWEVNQWLMAKAGEDYIDTYRAVMIPKDDLVGHEQRLVEGAGRNYRQLPDIQLRRSGAQSTTASRTVANSWNGVGVPHYGGHERVVLRIRAPRTSVLSLPVYGQNIHGEHETVLFGSRDHWNWDAWLDQAPNYSSVTPDWLKHMQKRHGAESKKPPLVIDLFEIDKGKPDWLSEISPEAARGIEKIREERARNPKPRRKPQPKRLGGPGSGNFGHEGRPGQIGGSAPSGGSATPSSASGPAGSAKLAEAISAGGFTYNPVTGDQPQEGFCVSIYKGRERVIPVRDMSPAQIKRYIDENRDLLLQPGNHIGGWRDGDDFYLDVSIVTKSREEAMRLAREHHQKAIYDLKAGQSLDTEEEVASGFKAARTAHGREQAGALPRGRAGPLANARRLHRALPGDPGEGTHGRGDRRGAPPVREGESAALILIAAGGPGSGNWGHAGRPGEVGGSAPAAGGGGNRSEAVKVGGKERTPEEIEAINKLAPRARPAPVEGTRAKVNATLEKAGFKVVPARDLNQGQREASNLADDALDDPEIAPDVDIRARATGEALEMLRTSEYENLQGLHKIIAENLNGVIVAPLPEEMSGVSYATLVGHGEAYVQINSGHDQREWMNFNVKYDNANTVGATEALNLLRAGGTMDDALALEAKYAAIHEFGHLYDAASGGMAKMDFVATIGSTHHAREIFPGMMELPKEAIHWLGENISNYAMSSPEEGFAETFTRVVFGMKIPPELETWAKHIRGPRRQKAPSVPKQKAPRHPRRRHGAVEPKVVWGDGKPSPDFHIVDDGDPGFSIPYEPLRPPEGDQAHNRTKTGDTPMKSAEPRTAVAAVEGEGAPPSLLQRVLAKLGIRTAAPAVEGTSVGDLRDDLYEALAAIEGANFGGIADFYTDDGKVIYFISTGAPDSDFEWFMRDFEVEDDGVVSLGAERTRVEPVTRYETVVEVTATPVSRSMRAAAPANEPGETVVVAPPNGQAARGGCEMTKKELVGRLLANAATPFVEGDSKVLESFDEARLEALVAHCEKLTEAPKPKPETPVTPPEPKPLTEEEHIAALSAETRSLLDGARKGEADRREKLIKALSEAQESFTAEELQSKSSAELAKLASLLDLDAPAEPNYTGRGLAVPEPNTAQAPDPWAGPLAERRKLLGLS